MDSLQCIFVCGTEEGDSAGRQLRHNLAASPLTYWRRRRRRRREGGAPAVRVDQLLAPVPLEPLPKVVDDGRLVQKTGGGVWGWEGGREGQRRDAPRFQWPARELWKADGVPGEGGGEYGNLRLVSWSTPCPAVSTSRGKRASRSTVWLAPASVLTWHRVASPSIVCRLTSAFTYIPSSTNQTFDDVMPPPPQPPPPPGLGSLVVLDLMILELNPSILFIAGAQGLVLKGLDFLCVHQIQSQSILNLPG